MNIFVLVDLNRDASLNPISNSIPSLTWKCVKTSVLFSSLPNLFYYQKKNMYTGHCNSYWSLVSFTYSPSGWLHKLACFGNQQAVTIQGRNLLYFIYVKWYFLVNLWMTWQKETYANLSYMTCPNKHLNTVFHLAILETERYKFCKIILLDGPVQLTEVQIIYSNTLA